MHYLEGKSTIIDRDYFARLIRKHKGLTCFIRDYDGESITCFRMPAKEAVSKLLEGDFDALVWQQDADGSADLYGQRAPAHIQLERRAAQLRQKIAEREQSLAKAVHPENREYLAGWLSRNRFELGQVEAKLRTARAALRPQPLAAAA